MSISFNSIPSGAPQYKPVPQRIKSAEGYISCIVSALNSSGRDAKMMLEGSLRKLEKLLGTENGFIKEIKLSLEQENNSAFEIGSEERSAQVRQTKLEVAEIGKRIIQDLRASG